MAETNKDKWVNNFAKSIGAEPEAQANQPAEENNNVDKYGALETTSYKDMLSSKIQAANAKETAQKYSANVLNANGLGTQGLSESARTGIMGNYGKAIAAADETHNQNLMDIESQRQADLETKSEADWQSAMTMLSQAQNQQDLDYIKENFYPTMNDQQKKMFDYYYSSYSGSFNAGKYNSLDALSKATYEDTKGNISTLSEHFPEETKVLWHHGSNGDYQDGDIIKITNGEGDTIYMKWVGNGFSTTTAAEYDAHNNINTFELKRGKDKNNIYLQTHEK